MDTKNQNATQKASDHKKQLREYYRKRVSSQPNDNLINENIIKNLLEVLPAQSLAAGFMAKDHEPDLVGMYQLPLYDFVFPKVTGETLQFFKPKSLKNFIESAWGVMEPDPAQSTLVPLQKIQLILIPALAFDRQFYRLGRGKGFYDRILNGFKGLKVGVARADQISNQALPHEEHDERMDVIVTENFIMSRLDS